MENNKYDKKNFTLIVYEKIGNSEPIFKGSKQIDQDEYAALVKYLKKSVELNKSFWDIIERVWFKEPILDTVYYRIIVFTQKA